MVVEQLDDLDQNIMTEILAGKVDNDKKEKEKSVETTEFQTNTIGAKDQVINTDGCELSVETKTVVVTDNN